MHEVGNDLQCYKDKDFVTLCIGLEADADYLPIKRQTPGNTLEVVEAFYLRSEIRQNARAGSNVQSRLRKAVI